MGKIRKTFSISAELADFLDKLDNQSGWIEAVLSNTRLMISNLEEQKKIKLKEISDIDSSIVFLKGAEEKVLNSLGETQKEELRRIYMILKEHPERRLELLRIWLKMFNEQFTTNFTYNEFIILLRRHTDYDG